MAEAETRSTKSGLSVGERSQNLGLGFALLCALAILLGVVNWHYPITQWLVWRYLSAGSLALFWAVSCLSFGYALLPRFGFRAEGRSAEAVLAFPLGVLAFQITMFVLGIAGLLGAATFVLLPVAFVLAGRRKLAETARHLLAGLAPPRTFAQLGISLFGIVGIAILYFQILSPESLHWDARWYHLPLAQQYALDGAIRPSPERWWLAGYPHSASLLYTWAFLLPNALLFDRLELCLHIEFVVFLATIASIPTLIRHLMPGLSARGTWAAIFLFPGIFLYDSNLSGAADHIAALWCIPIAVTLIQLWETWTIPRSALFGAFLGAGLAAKYSAWSMLIFPGILFLGRAAWLAVCQLVGRRKPAGAILPPFVVGSAVTLLVSSQHWLKNWIWYGDPLYPILHNYFRVQPWSPEASASYRLYTSFAFPPLPGWAGVREALQTIFTFSFIPNDWPVFHRNVPVFGFLFTLSMLCLPFIRAGAKLIVAYISVLASIVIWYLTTHQDRYLQAWLPVMVACTMATLGLVWKSRNHVIRGLVTALVAFQVLWGGDVPFFPTHNLINDSPFRLVSNFLASGFLRNQNRFRLFGDEGLVAERLPREAKLLVHETNMHVGFGVRAINDQWQSRLSYASLASPVAIYRELSNLQVTHLTWEARPSGWNSLGSDLAFMGFALNNAVDQVQLGQFTLAHFPIVPPPTEFNERVAMLACGNPYPNGFYKVRNLTEPDPGQPWATPDAPIPDLEAAVREAGFMVVDPACAPTLPPDAGVRFHPPISMVRGPLRLYIRRS